MSSLVNTQSLHLFATHLYTDTLKRLHTNTLTFFHKGKHHPHSHHHLSSAHTHLKNAAADEPVTAVTPDPKLSMVVSLTVRNPISADRKRKTESRLCASVTLLFILKGSDKRIPATLLSEKSLQYTYLLMYSPVSVQPHVRHLKQVTCHCLSSASRD